MNAAAQAATKKRKRNGGLFVFAMLAALIILPIAFQPTVGLVAYPYTLSEGDRVGQVVKLSRRGIVWKTWEGSLGVTQSGAYVEKWNFSVDPSAVNAAELVDELQAASESGDIVKISYKQHIGIRSWHGKTSYSIESIQILGSSGYRTTLPRLNSPSSKP